jgi:hypothetical protein
VIGPVWDGIKEKCDSSLSYFPEQYGNAGNISQSTAHEFMQKIILFAFAWQMSDDTMYADMARRIILTAATVEDWRDAGTPENYDADLGLAALTRGIAVGFEFLNDYLTATEKETILSALYNKGVLPCYNHIVDLQEINMATNWGGVILGGGGIGCLLLSIEEYGNASDLLSIFCTELEYRMEAYYNSDGETQEALRYWNYSTEYILAFIEPLHRLGIQNFYTISGFEHSIDFVFHLRSLAATGIKGTLNICDCKFMEEALSSSILKFASHFSDVTAQYYWKSVYENNPEWLEAALEPDMVFSYIWYTDFVSPYLQFFMPETAWFSGRNYYDLRDGLSLQNVYGNIRLFFKNEPGGAIGHNCHEDRGSFIIEAFGERLAIDSGVGNYSSPDYFGWYLTAAAHNVLMIDGLGQDETTSKVSYIDQNETWNTTNYNYLVSNLLGSYEDRDINSYFRKIIYVRPGYFVIIDEIKSSSSRKYEWQLHSLGTPTISINTSSDIITVDRPKADMFVRILEPADYNYNIAQGNVDQEEGNDYIRFSRTGDIADGNIITVLHPFPNANETESTFLHNVQQLSTNSIDVSALAIDRNGQGNWTVVLSNHGLSQLVTVSNFPRMGEFLKDVHTGETYPLGNSAVEVLLQSYETRVFELNVQDTELYLCGNNNDSSADMLTTSLETVDVYLSNGDKVPKEILPAGYSNQTHKINLHFNLYSTKEVTLVIDYCGRKDAIGRDDDINIKVNGSHFSYLDPVDGTAPGGLRIQTELIQSITIPSEYLVLGENIITLDMSHISQQYLAYEFDRIIIKQVSNPFINPSFENSGNWGYINYQNMFFYNRSDDEVFSGRWSAKLYGNQSNSRGSVKQSVSLASGKTYKIRTYLKTDSIIPSGASNHDGAIVRIILQGNGMPQINFYFGDQGTENGITGTNNWTLIEGIFEVPEGYDSAMVEGFLFFASGVVWWDDFKLEEHNLLLNSSFELDNNWSFVNYQQMSSLTFTDSCAYTGKRACELFSSQNNGRGSVKQTLSVKPGATYKLSAYCRTDSVVPLGYSDNDGATIRVILQGAGLPQIHYFFNDEDSIDGITGTNAWTLIEGIFEVPEGYDNAIIEGFLFFASGAVWWDDIKLNIR